MSKLKQASSFVFFYVLILAVCFFGTLDLIDGEMYFSHLISTAKYCGFITLITALCVYFYAWASTEDKS